jgi:diguanylate cyclase (GGDEF)-like protein
LAVSVVLLAGVVSWLALDASRGVTERTNALVEEQIPELRAIGSLQDSLHRRVLNLYLYYATMEEALWETGGRIGDQIDAHLAELEGAAGLAEDGVVLRADIAELARYVDAFHLEMTKGRGRDWDVLREHLAGAQTVAGRIDGLLIAWAERIRAEVRDGGAATRLEVAQLNTMQIGFSIVLLLIVLIVVGMLIARIKDQAELYNRAYFDRLTGLPNRRRMEEDWQRSEPAKRRSLLLVKLDRYQLFTATFGHAVVDEIALLVVKRLQNAISIQRNDAQLYQFAPATWLIQVEDDEDHNASTLLSEMILRTALKPLQMAERELTVTSSIGVTHSPEHGDDVDELIHNADSALRTAQLKGECRAAVYLRRMKEQSEQFLNIEAAMRKGLHNTEFELFYQPKLDATDLICTGAEALVRWRREGELVSPGEFIPVAEESGFIMALGRWVIEEACRQWQEWSHAGSAVLPIAVNVSAQQFQAPDFVDEVAQALEKHSVPPSMLELEITEEATFGDPDAVVASLRALKDLGVTLAIDDFGTGYSSLAYLKTFPVDVLKIDRAFIHDMDESARDLSIVNMMVMLGRKLGFKVVAEGVETEYQQEHLRNIGCDLLQGFLYSKPLPADEFASFTARAASDVA